MSPDFQHIKRAIETSRILRAGGIKTGDRKLYWLSYVAPDGSTVRECYLSRFDRDRRAEALARANRASGPYVLVVVRTDGSEIIVDRGHNPVAVSEAHHRVTRNNKAFDRIELRDGSGVLETIWKASWS